MTTEAEIIEIVHRRYMARTPTPHPRPDKISVDKYGHHASYVEHANHIRVWGFMSESGRDLFVEDFKANVP